MLRARKVKSWNIVLLVLKYGGVLKGENYEHQDSTFRLGRHPH